MLADSAISGTPISATLSASTRVVLTGKSICAAMRSAASVQLPADSVVLVSTSSLCSRPEGTSPRISASNSTAYSYGVETIAQHYQFGRVRLPYKRNTTGFALSMELIREVTNYPHFRTDDQVMAHTIGWDESVRSKVEELMERLPEDLRTRYPTPEAIAALYISKFALDVSAIQIAQLNERMGAMEKAMRGER